MVATNVLLYYNRLEQARRRGKLRSIARASQKFRVLQRDCRAKPDRVGKSCRKEPATATATRATATNNPKRPKGSSRGPLRSSVVGLLPCRDFPAILWMASWW